MRKRLARILGQIANTLNTAGDLVARRALRLRGWGTIAGAQEEPPEKTYTQAEHEAKLNQVVQERLARDRKDRISDDEIADLKRRAAKADELEAANLSQAEKLQQEAAKAAEERDAAKAEAQAAREEANSTKLQSKIIAAAAKAGAVDPDDVHALMQARNFAVTKDGKELKVTIGDDGQVTGHEEAVTAFLEGKQHLVGQTPTPGPGGGGPRPTAVPALTQEELAMAKSFEMTPEEYAANK